MATTRKKYKSVRPFTYTLVDELMASATHPMAPEIQRAHLEVMVAGLGNIERAATPRAEDWRVVSDAVNVMETLIKHGPWSSAPGELTEVDDASGLLADAMAAMAIAGIKHLEEGKPIRLNAYGILAVRALLRDYAEIIAALPHRTMVQAHRRTERRIRKETSRAQHQAGSTQVVDV